MIRSKWFAALGCLGMGVGAVFTGQGCTATASLCTGSTCPQFDAGYFPPVDDSGTPGVDSSTPTTDAGTDSGSTPIDPCNACLYGQCVSPYSNCVTNASCLAIYQCSTSPACAADGGCVQDCYQAGTSTGQVLYLALGNCDQAAECSNVSASAPCATVCNVSPCSVPDAGSGDSALPGDDAGTDAGADATASQTCSECTAANCSQQIAACATGTECAAYNQCLAGCASLACDNACGSAYPNGAAAAMALGNCTAANCSAQCFQ